MTTEGYRQSISGTIRLYPNKIKQHIKGLMFSKNIGFENDTQISIHDQSQSAEEPLNLSGMEISDQIIKCIQKPAGTTVFEKWELDKDYKYSTVFIANDFEKLVEHVKELKKAETDDESLLTIAMDAARIEPIPYDVDNKRVLKFAYTFSAVHPQTGNEQVLKYTVLVVFHEEEKLVEFRFDSLKYYFIPSNASQNFYSEVIKKHVAYFNDKFDIKLTGLDLNFMREATEPSVVLIAQNMRMASGGRAILEVGDNEACVLPFIDELKAIIKEYADELESAPGLSDTLNQFIIEKCEMSEYPWIEIKWDHEIKTRAISVKITFNYNGCDCALIQHLYNHVIIGKERMERVIGYIGRNKKDTE